MKRKTSVTLSEEVLRAVDEIAGERGRSSFVEESIRHYLRARARAEIHEHDLALLDESADALNAVAADVLEYQAYWDTLENEAP